MNILDRAIAVIAPLHGVKRAQARKALAIYGEARSYDGGKVSRRLPSRQPSTSANAAMGNADFVQVRNRARHMRRNTPHGSRAVEVFVSNAVGTGIMPASRTGNKKTDKKVNDLWKKFCDECDADGQLNWAGMQALAVSSMYEGGEALARLRTRREEDGLTVPLQIQLMEGDHIDNSRHGQTADGRNVLGIEFDKLGRRRRYWLYPEHPGEMSTIAVPTSSSVPVDASEIVHLYRKLRIGQVRGISAFAPVILTGYDLQELWEAIVVKSRIEACFSVFITSDESDATAIGAEKKDAAGNVVRELQPGLIHNLRPGEEVQFANPSSTQNVDPILIHSYMGMSTGLGLTLDQLTGDLRQANYSSLRAGKVEQRRLIEQFQYQTLVPMFCAPIRKRWLEMAILSGKLKGSPEDYPCEWIAPSFEPIDPVKDLTADIMAVRAGRMTPQQFIMAWGNDFDSHIESLKEAFDTFDKYGLTLDIDPRKTSQAGLMQQQQPQDQPTPQAA